MANFATCSLIELLMSQHKEQMDEQVKQYTEEIDEQARHYREEMEKQARQYRKKNEQVRQDLKQMAILTEQVKTKMKKLIQAACDGARGSSTLRASFQPLDSSSDCGWTAWKNSGLSSQQI